MGTKERVDFSESLHSGGVSSFGVLRKPVNFLLNRLVKRFGLLIVEATLAICPLARGR
ncbi:MAG: hypothetical protein KatS3mg102_0344 [Planctomycetota bacterium]|nr:MAG: hypothetical protein KatS3mg102_0344 [Planctomycetota bacterium]